MKINWKEHSERVVGWFIIAAITGNDDEKISQKIVANRNSDGLDEVTLTMNGVELNMVDTFNRLQKNYDSAVRREAEELVERKLYGMFDEIQDVLMESRDNLKENMDSVFEKLTK